MWRQKISLWLVKIDRLAAWILLFSILLYFLSGFGMTKGLINRNLATQLHSNILPFIAIISFSIHTSLAVRLSLIRWRLWNVFSKFLLIISYVILILGFFYIIFYYQGSKKVEPRTDGGKTVQNDSYSKDRIFTKEELMQYDGKDGRPAYASVDGIVYDLTEVFQDGKHYEHLAGRELTEAFYSKHVKSQITKYPIVGKYEN